MNHLGIVFGKRRHELCDPRMEIGQFLFVVTIGRTLNRGRKCVSRGGSSDARLRLPLHAFSLGAHKLTLQLSQAIFANAVAAL